MLRILHVATHDPLDFNRLATGGCVFSNYAKKFNDYSDRDSVNPIFFHTSIENWKRVEVLHGSSSLIVHILVRARESTDDTQGS